MAKYVKKGGNVMQINVEELLRKLEEQKEEHSSVRKEIEFLVDQQAKTLHEQLKELKPVYEWYRSNHLVFTHPTIKVRSSSGPVLGFDEKDNVAIVYNVEKEQPEKIVLHDPDNRKFYHLHSLVEDGYFTDAMNGLRYLETMLESYISQSNSVIQRLKSQIEEI
jgi:hypothetical protein